MLQNTFRHFEIIIITGLNTLYGECTMSFIHYCLTVNILLGGQQTAFSLCNFSFSKEVYFDLLSCETLLKAS